MSGDNLATIFVSYAEEDEATALALVGALSHTRFKRWIAPHVVTLGDQWVARIEEGLRESTYLVLVWSRAAASSAWVGKEWRSFLTKLGKQRIEVLPVCIEAVELPMLLSEYQCTAWWQDRERAVEALVAYFEREQRSLLGLESVRGDGAWAGATVREVRLVAAKIFDDALWAAFLEDVSYVPKGQEREDLYGKISAVVADDTRLAELVAWLGAERPNEVAAALRSLRRGADPTP